MPEQTNSKPTFVDEIVNAFRTGTRCFLCCGPGSYDYVSPTTTRPLDFLAEHLYKIGRRVFILDFARGLRPYPIPENVRGCGEIVSTTLRITFEPLKPNEWSRHLGSGTDFLELLDVMLHQPEAGRCAFLCEQAELAFPASPVMTNEDRRRIQLVRSWATDKSLLYTLVEEARSRTTSPMIVFFASSRVSVHPLLTAADSGIELIEMPLPDLESRRAFIAQRAQDLRLEIDVDRVARITGGLRLSRIRSLLIDARRSGSFSEEKMANQRARSIAQEFGEILELLDGKVGLEDLKGSTLVRQFLLKEIVPYLHKDPHKLPSGILFTGPPGTGKTLLVAALAKSAGVAAAKLSIGRLLGRYVGESEENLERALACISALRPVIVCIDEVEQQLQRGEGSDGGVERRVFARILEAMSGLDSFPPGEVFWVAATNRVDLLDPALLRPGRFEFVVPILPPTDQERLEIMRNIVPALSDPTTDEQAAFTGATKLFTGADLAALAKAAERHGDISWPLLIALARVRKPLAARNQDFNLMMQQAINLCSDERLLPKEQS